MSCSPVTSPWVDLDDVLKIYAPELLVNPGAFDSSFTNSYDIQVLGSAGDAWQIAIDEATWVLFTLTGGKIHPAECWVEDYSSRGSCKVTLRRAPVDEIQQVWVVRSCGAEVQQLTDWCHESARTLNLCCGGTFFYGEDGRRYRCGCHDEVIRVQYSTCSTLPPGTGLLVAWLADQYMKAATGQKCQLPERVTSIQRQGVSWTMLDPMDFLQHGLTGMGRIDQWLSVVRRAYPSAEFIDPLRSLRLFSEQVACGAPVQLPSYAKGP